MRLPDKYTSVLGDVVYEEPFPNDYIDADVVFDSVYCGTAERMPIVKERE